MSDDPCACFNHEAAMRRLLSVLRGTEDQECTDSDCVTPNVNPGSQMYLVFWSLMWGLLMMGWFFRRQNRTAPQPDEKPSSSGQDPHGDQDQGPGPSVH